MHRAFSDEAVFDLLTTKFKSFLKRGNSTSQQSRKLRAFLGVLVTDNPTPLDI